MIAQLISWFLAFAAVCLFGIMVGIEIGSKKGWHRGRAALIREQRGIRASIDRGDRVIRFPAPASIDEVDDYMAYARARHPSLYDREAEA